jgi:hypothetical protein
MAATMNKIINVLYSLITSQVLIVLFC